MQQQGADIHETLKRWWGFDTFRPVQERIIRDVMSGRDTLALMPTGGGKSLTYQVPAMASEGLCIVVTPLIALMKDQVDRLRQRGILASAVHSGMSQNQIDKVLDNCVYGDVKLLYVAPERLGTETFRMRVQRMNVSLLAVDEAHCISQWGYDFRPAYLNIASIRKLLPDVPVLALTASATNTVADDIMHHLQFREPHILRSSFARKNLSYSVRHVDDKNGQLLRIIRNVGGSGIVYVRTRKGTEEVAEYLRNEGVAATAYNGGLPHAERSLRQEEWLSGKVRIMVATNAFGMGIDKADVRFVVHYSMCDSLESYYQEAGRAGRDGQRSYALLLVAADDDERIRRKFDAEFPPLARVREVYERVCDYCQVGIGEGKEASFLFNIHEFCARNRIFGDTVRSALKLLSVNGYMTLVDEMDNPARIMFCVSRDDLYKLRVMRQEVDHILRVILRLYDGVFSTFRSIDEMQIAAVSGYTIDKVRELLKLLWQLRVIRYIPANRSPILFFNEERLPTADIVIAPETYSRRRELAEERFANMTAYAYNDTRCRSRVLQEYFGDNDEADCGVCDICLARRRAAKAAQAEQGGTKKASPADTSPAAEQTGSDTESRIMELLAAEPRDIRALVAEFRNDDEMVVAAVRKLLDEGKISTGKEGILAINR